MKIFDYGVSRINRRDFLRTAATTALAATSPITSLGAAPKKKPNILFIAVDDLRPQLNCFGHQQMISPNLDRLASEGVIFSRCYCQVPVCGASRASLLSGVRPTRNRFVGYDTWQDKESGQNRQRLRVIAERLQYLGGGAGAAGGGGGGERGGEEEDAVASASVGGHHQAVA